MPPDFFQSARVFSWTRLLERKVLKILASVISILYIFRTLAQIVYSKSGALSLISLSRF